VNDSGLPKLISQLKVDSSQSYTRHAVRSYARLSHISVMGQCFPAENFTSLSAECQILSSLPINLVIGLQLVALVTRVGHNQGPTWGRLKKVLLRALTPGQPALLEKVPTNVSGVQQLQTPELPRKSPLDTVLLDSSGGNMKRRTWLNPGSKVCPVGNSFTW
jgi:hypothetical protein